MWRGFSLKFHVISCYKSTAIRSKSTPNSMTIPCHLSRFYLFSMLKHDMDFGQGQVMEFLRHLVRKWWDFHRIWCNFRIKLPSKRRGKIAVTFFTRTFRLLLWWWLLYYYMAKYVTIKICIFSTDPRSIRRNRERFNWDWKKRRGWGRTFKWYEGYCWSSGSK